MSEGKHTPETDSVEFQFRDEDGVHCFAVHSGFARRLERERDEARETSRELLDALETTLHVRGTSDDNEAHREYLISVIFKAKGEKP